MINDNDIFKTSDFYLAVTLISLNFEVIGLDKSNLKKISFNFRETTELRKAIDDFWDNRISLNPKVIFNSSKELKARMYANNK